MYKTIKLDYARNSLKYLIRAFEIKEIRMPYYLCDVMRHAAFAEGCKPLFYHIDDNFMPVNNFRDDEFVLYPNYFGVFDKNVEILSKIYPKLIVDNAHSISSTPQGLACFNSVRKFIPNRVESFLFIKRKASDFAQTKPDDDIKMTERRFIYFKKLHHQYKKINLLKLDFEYIKSPFCYPCLTATDEEADRLAESLERDGKTIYRYWGELPKTFNEYKFYRRLVPIPLCY